VVLGRRGQFFVTGEEGLKLPERCKFPAEVPEVILLEAIELLPVSEVARQSIAEVLVWKV
jgi:hypothetical protein